MNKICVLIFISFAINTLFGTSPLFGNTDDIVLDELERSILRFEYARAIELFDSIKQNEFNFDSKQKLRKLWLEASFYYRNHIYDKSFEVVRELQTTAEFYRDTFYLGRALYRKGTIYSNIGKADNYLDYIGRAKVIALEASDYTTQARCKMGELNRIFVLNSETFEYLDKGYTQCFELVKDLEGDYAYDTQLAILFNQFEVYQKYEVDYLELIQSILSLSKLAQRQDTYAGGMFRMHKYYLTKKDTVNVMSALNTAYDIAYKIDDNIILSEVSEALSKMYKSLNKQGLALEYAMKVIKFNNAKEGFFIKSSQNALSRYSEITELSTENKKLLELNELAAINMDQLRKMNLGIGLFGLFLLLSGLFWLQQYKVKNKNRLIMAEQSAQIWNERFMSAEKDRKMDLLTSFQEGQEIIKDRIATVLHDKIAGGIAGIKLFLSNEKTLLKEDIKPILDQLDVLYDYSRNLSHFYYDPIPENESFCDLIKKKAEQSMYNTGIQLECILFPEEKINKLSTLIKSEVLRYVSELIRNMEVHSQASIGEITLTLQEDGLYIIVVDNGVGKVKKEAGGEGIGIQLIRKKLALLEGDMEISSHEQKGYTCIIFIPSKIILNTEQTKSHA